MPLEFELTSAMALDLVRLNDGMLICGDLPILSLPFLVRGAIPATERGLVAHYDATRAEYTAALNRLDTVTVVFQVGFHYIDPSWIPAVPHAPTEVKAVFQFRGRPRVLHLDRTDLLSILSETTKAKRAKYGLDSSWSMDVLPAQYIDDMLSGLSLVSVSAERFHVSRLMVLAHLPEQCRAAVAGKLEALNSPASLEAATLIRIFPCSVANTSNQGLATSVK